MLLSQPMSVRTALSCETSSCLSPVVLFPCLSRCSSPSTPPIAEFHPRMIGLTGTPEQVKAAARAFRVYYMKTEEEGYDYLVDHSIIS
ncbi:unnamed protein product [Closterium sp. NIES-54]